MSSSRSLLLTGASGMLGTAILQKFATMPHVNVTALNFNRPIRVTASNITSLHCDLRAPVELDRQLQGRVFDQVIHCAALTRLEQCESYFHDAVGYNVESTYNLIRMLNAQKAPYQFVYISSDAVYAEGQAGQKKAESFAVVPQNIYGISKLWSENLVQSFVKDYLIFRTTIVGPDQAQFVGWILNQARAGIEIPLLSDVNFTPLDVWTAAEAIDVALTKNVSGVYNLASTDALSKAEFAEQLLKRMNLPHKVRNISLKDLPSKVNRSFNMALDCKKFEGQIMPLPDVEKVLQNIQGQVSR